MIHAFLSQVRLSLFIIIVCQCQVVSLIGFVKLDDKSAAWVEGDGGPSHDLEHLIRKSLNDKKELLVDTQFKDDIEKKNCKFILA